MFTIFYAFFGMSLVALCFVELANLALEAREKLKRSMRAGAVDAASSYITQQAHEIRRTGSDSSTRLSRLHRTSRTACSSGYCRKFQERRPITVTILSVTIFILCFGAIFHAVEKGHNNMHFSDSVYFAMISATTIGYVSVLSKYNFMKFDHIIIAVHPTGTEIIIRRRQLQNGASYACSLRRFCLCPGA